MPAQNTTTLKEYFEHKIKTLEERENMKYENLIRTLDSEKKTTIDRETAKEKALDLAAQSLDKRLEVMNEFRDAMKDQQNKFVTREESVLIHDRLADDIRILRESKANMEGKASMTSVYISYAIAVIALAISIIRIFI